MPRKTIALATAAVAVALLAGCSDAGSDGGSGPGPTPAAEGSTPAASARATQTRAEACTSLQRDLGDVSQGLQSRVSSFQSDPDAAVAELREFDAELRSAADEVTNERVHAAVTEFEGSFSGLLEQLEAYSDDPGSVDVAELQGSIEDVQASTTGMSEVCAGS